MITQIVGDLAAYVVVYIIIIAALLFFNIANMPSSEGFGQSGTITDGMTSSVLVAWQMGVMGDFDMFSYSNFRNTTVAKVAFVAFSAFGLLIM